MRYLRTIKRDGAARRESAWLNTSSIHVFLEFRVLEFRVLEFRVLEFNHR
jgi:hypothetical protein